MKSLFKKTAILCISSLLVFSSIGCENEGPAEKAGKQLDEAVDTFKEKAEEATE